EALRTFLLSYRITANAMLGNRLPAEVLLRRQLHTSMDLIRPTPPTAVRRNDRMEADFNQRHGARDRSFTRDDFVLVRNYLFQKT
uniref:Uncharacterized protein n=1 Tax=Parascaris univalens TaxID=6257 RepID=A0A914ZZK7_PARUN